MSKNTPFATTEQGFIKVNDTYECVNHPGVFAAGDCCHMVQHPRPKAGVFAVRAGPPLQVNLLNFLTKQPLVVHKPQETFLGLISTGDPYAIASRGSWLAWEGEKLWHWKDSIDRKWMEKYTDLPDLEKMMETMDMKFSKSIPSTVSQKGPEVMAAFAAEAMRCGGCGAKVGASTVARVLNSIHKRQKRRAKQFNLKPPPQIDHDDAAVVPVPKGGGAMINTIDYFRSFVSDPFVFGKIAAVHALSDVHAMGAKAQTALALAVVPFAADEQITESTLMELLSGASDILQDEDVHIVGGHTCEGDELACGFAIQGFTSNPEKLLRKKGGKVGDKIVLTKPVGTGALFAADMRAKCKGDYVMEALKSMSVSNVKGSEVAARTKGVHSCTDVTGFGLAGHLLEMLVAEEETPIGAVLNIDDIPFLKGGLEASSNQIFSSLQPANATNRRAVSNHVEIAGKRSVEYPLLFDPQTAGGLMFFVDPDACPGFLKELEQYFPSTCVIGEIVPYEENADDMNGAVCTIGSGGRSTGLRLQVNYTDEQNGTSTTR
jgi:selenide,water dikinase